MKITVMNDRELRTLTLPADPAGQVPVSVPTEAGEYRAAVLRARAGGWVLEPPEEADFVRIGAGGVPEICAERSLPVTPGEDWLLRVRRPGGWELVRLLAEPETLGRDRFTRYALPDSGSVWVGSSPECQIRWPGFGPGVRVLELKCGPEGCSVRATHDILWNLYVDRRCVTAVPLRPGSTLYCRGLRLMLGAGFVAVNDPDGGLSCSLRPVAAPMTAALPAQPVGDVEFSVAPAAALLPQQEEIQVAAPPQELPEEGGPSTLMSVLPSGMMALAMLVTCMVGLSGLGDGSTSIGSAVSSLIMVACMLLACVLPVFNARAARRRRAAKVARQNRDYRDYLTALTERIRRECAVEKFNLQLRNPPLEGDALHLTLPDAPEQSRNVPSCAARSSMNGWKGLWERKVQDRDFLHLMVGEGTRAPSCAVLKPDRPEVGELPALYREMEETLQSAPRLTDAPVTLDLRTHRLVGIVGRRRSAVLAEALGLLVELTALHAYDDVKVVLIHGEGERDFWRFAKWMPHLWNEDRTRRYLAGDPAEIKALSQHLLEQMRGREKQTGDKKPHTPFYVIVNADQSLGHRAEALRELYKDRYDAGMCVIELCENARQLPKNCTAILDTDQQTLSLLQGGTAQVQGLSRLLRFEGDPEALFANMAHIRLTDAAAGSELPEKLSFLEMHRAGSADQLSVLRRWRGSDPVRSLSAVVGVDRDGFPVELDVHEKAHGPHGLVAGMTGSGKSEWLISYILSMAASYRPTEVAFILIDFKGGGMADVFRDLPHLAGAITNLDGNELRRSFLAIESELKHRQEVFQQAKQALGLSSMDIYDYQSLYRQGRVSEPLPHLIIVSDEFAELKNQQGGFMSQLIRIARIGRSLGVHLTLATQKPDGVVDEQIRSNIRFKVCLKVQDRADSQSMLGSPEAAAITTAGRFYLQVGCNEIFEQGQSGYSGLPYLAKEQYEEPRDLTLRLLNGQGVPVAAAAPAVRGADPDYREVNAVLAAIAEAAKAEGLTQKPVWAAPIPTVRRAVQVRAGRDEGHELEPQVGLYDDLRARCHKPLTVPFTAKGSAVVYGASGAGKLDFVNRVLTRCMERHSPEEVQFWLADAEAGILQAYEGSSHTAWLALPGEYDRFGEMLTRLTDELERRRQTLQPYGGDRERYLAAGGKMPLALCVIHDAGSFLGGDNGDRLVEALRDLGRNGKKYGILLLLTAVDSRSLHYSLKSLLPQVFVLRQNSDEDYADLLGRTRGMTPSEGKGRGLIRVDEPDSENGYAIYEFQVEMPFAAEPNPYEALCALVRAQTDRWGGGKRVFRMPGHLDAAYFEQFPCERDKVPVALTREGEPVYWDFTQKDTALLPCGFADGAAHCRGMAALLRRACCEEVLVLDGIGDFGELEGCRVVSGDDLPGEVEALLARIGKRITDHRAHFDATGEKLALPPLGLVLYGGSELADRLSRDHVAALDAVLARLGPNLALFTVLCSRFEDGSYSDFAAVAARLPAQSGLALQKPDTHSQNLLRCAELSRTSPFAGLVREGKLIPCGFAEA